jgi:hypothetical protein
MPDLGCGSCLTTAVLGCFWAWQAPDVVNAIAELWRQVTEEEKRQWEALVRWFGSEAHTCMHRHMHT